MWIVIIILSILVLILWSINIYKTKVIEDYETRLPRLYQEFVDDAIRCKSYLDFEERASRETNVRKELNYMIDKYAGYCRKDNAKKFESLIEEGSNEYIKRTRT